MAIKTMGKKTIAKLIILAALFMFIGACKKYEDGPKISLLTSKARVVNKWKLQKYFEGSVDKTASRQLAIPYEYVEFKNDYTRIEELTDNSGNVHVYKGKWSLHAKRTEIVYTPDDPNNTIIIFSILRLKSKEMWLRNQFNREFQYVQR